MHACPSHSGLWNTRKRFVAVLVLRESHVLTQPLSKFQDNLALHAVSYPCVCVYALVADMSDLCSFDSATGALLPTPQHVYRMPARWHVLVRGG